MSNFNLSHLSHGTNGTVLETPIALFLSHLLSLGHTGQEVAEIVRLAEAAFQPKSSSSIENKREKERLRKAAYRANLSQNVPKCPVGQTGQIRQDSFLSLEVTKTLNPIKKKESKEEVERENTRASVPNVPRDKVGQTAGQVDDGWPDNYLEIFWYKFPPYRRQAKRKVGEKLARLRRDKIVTWTVLITGVERFVATNPGEYAPAPMVWLNDGRWDREYGSQQIGGSNGKTSNALGGFSGLSAKLRRKIADQEESFDDYAGGGEPIYGR